MQAVKDVLARFLGLVYPGVAFDVSGLTRLLLPCAAVLLAALVIYLFLKIIPGIRHFAYTVPTVALILLIAANVFFPATLAKAGDEMGNAVTQWLEARESPPPENAPAVVTEE